MKKRPSDWKLKASVTGVCISLLMSAMLPACGRSIVTCQAAYPSTLISGTANLSLWLDASDTNNLYQTSDCTTTRANTENDPVGCIKDKSANLYHFTQTTNSKRPTLKLTGFQNLPTLQFDQAQLTHLKSDQAIITGSDFTAFFVLQVPLNDGDRQFYDQGTTGGIRRTMAVDSTGGMYYMKNGTFFYHVAKYNTNRLITLTENGASATMAETANGGTSGTVHASTSASGTPSVIGARHTQNGFYINSMISEVVIVNRLLNDSEKLNIQKHLECKYGMAQ